MNWLVVLFALLVLLPLGGPTTVQSVVGPDGSEDLLIKLCPSIEVCYDKAKSACGGGPYKIVNTSSDSASNRLNLLIQCKN